MTSVPPVPIAVLRGHSDFVNCTKFVNATVLISGSVSGQLKIWKTMDRRCMADNDEAHGHSIQSIGQMSGHSFVTSGRDGMLNLWNIADIQKPLIRLQSGCNHFCNASTDKQKFDEHTIVSATNDTTKILVWDIRTPGSPVSIVDTSIDSTSRGMVTSLLYSSNSAAGPAVSSSSNAGNIVAGFEDGSVAIYDMRNLQKPVTSRKVHSEPVFALETYTRRGVSLLVSGSADASMHRSTLPPMSTAVESSAGVTYDSSTDSDDSAELVSVDRVDLPSSGTSSIRCRDDGRLIVSCHWDSTVRLYDSKKMKPLAVLRHHRDGVNCVDFASNSDASSTNNNDGATTTTDGGIFATGSKDGTIAIWNVLQDTYNVR